MSVQVGALEHRCIHCHAVQDAGSRYCGECGVRTGASPAGDCAVATAPVSPLLKKQSKSERTPTFAKVSSPASKLLAELRSQHGDLVIELLRERIFLLFYWSLFLIINLFGFWVAMRCYREFIGDEVSKLMISMTPLMFINTIGLVCLASIKGTKQNIARLKEKLNYVKFQIEFGHLL